MSSFTARAGAWLIVLATLTLFVALAAPPANAFCGFYVGKADADLCNEASQVILVRRDGKTVISMANDYRGALTEFALVVPVPQVLERSQIHIGERELFERIDAYSAPRLAEYYDPDPCVAKVGADGPGVGAVHACIRREGGGEAREGAGRHGRRVLHGRRIRHRDAVREGIGRSRDLAARERLPDPEGRQRRASAPTCDRR